MWVVRETDEFREWFRGQESALQDDIIEHVKILAEIGPTLGRHYVDHLHNSRHTNMKELRVQSKGKPIRVLFVFDPERQAVLLVAGDKSSLGDKRFYKKMIPLADMLFDEYLRRLPNEKYEKKAVAQRPPKDVS